MVSELPCQGPDDQHANAAVSRPLLWEHAHIQGGDGHFSITALRTDPPRFALAGELDICSVPELTAALADAAGTLHLDLTEVCYCDLAALRVILGQPQTSDHQQHPARAVVLHHPPAQMVRILQLTGWDTLPSVTVDTTVNSR
jgi:anti-anti-sigma factor